MTENENGKRAEWMSDVVTDVTSSSMCTSVEQEEAKRFEIKASLFNFNMKNSSKCRRMGWKNLFNTFQAAQKVLQNLHLVLVSTGAIAGCNLLSSFTLENISMPCEDNESWKEIKMIINFAHRLRSYFLLLNVVVVLFFFFSALPWPAINNNSRTCWSTFF